MYTMWVIFPENDQMIMSVLYHSDTLSWQTLRQPVIVLTSVLTTAASLFLKVTFLQSLVSISSVICKRRLKCIYSKRMQITMLTTDRQTQSDDNTLQCISMYLWSSWANRLNLRINNMQICYWVQSYVTEYNLTNKDTVKPAHEVTSIKSNCQSPVSRGHLFLVNVIENLIWIEPLLSGHLS